MEASLAYHEPSLETLLILSSFLLLLNAVDYVLDSLVYCGLIGQIVVGLAWGTPGFGWLERSIEDAVMQLGYLGLILIVFEGGLSTSVKSLKANLLLSSSVAVTGIAAPIALSFCLGPMLGASPLQSFSVGAALCSTSLGTTFTVLASSGLSSTRLGIVLTSAAMMDDVVGLAMVQVISSLGGGHVGATTVIRPVFVSLGFAILIPVACRFLGKPVIMYLSAMRVKKRGSKLDRALGAKPVVFALQTLWLFGLVAAGIAAGTSSLLVAYLAGATITWCDSIDIAPLETHSQSTSQETSTKQTTESQNINTAAPPEHVQESLSPRTQGFQESISGVQIYHEYYAKPVSYVLKPFFFASIGFSIPITKMFAGPTVWRGIVYALLMVLGKLLCGLWLLSYVSPLAALRRSIRKLPGRSSQGQKSWAKCARRTNEPVRAQDPQDQTEAHAATAPGDPAVSAPTPVNVSSAAPEQFSVSLYPACILALAMVARGEIGYLISALAESNGVLGAGGKDASGPSDLFLVSTWAITICTVVGPVSVGLLVRRVKRLEARREGGSGNGRNVLGTWGVN